MYGEYKSILVSTQHIIMCFSSLPTEGRDFPAKCHLTRLPLEYCSLRNLVPSIYQGLVSLKRHACYLSSVRVRNGGVAKRRGLLR